MILTLRRAITAVALSAGLRNSVVGLPIRDIQINPLTFWFHYD